MSGIIGTSNSKSKVIGSSKDTAKAWACYDQDVGPTVRASFGLSSIADTDTGKFTCIFLNAMSSIHYSMVGTADGGNDVVFGYTEGHTATQCEVRSHNVGNGNYEDNAWNSVIFFGD